MILGRFYFFIGLLHFHANLLDLPVVLLNLILDFVGLLHLNSCSVLKLFFNLLNFRDDDFFVTVSIPSKPFSNQIILLVNKALKGVDKTQPSVSIVFLDARLGFAKNY